MTQMLLVKRIMC